MSFLLIATFLGGALVGGVAPHAVAICLSSGAVLAGCMTLFAATDMSPLVLPLVTLAALALHQTTFLATSVFVHGRSARQMELAALDAERETAAPDLAPAARAVEDPGADLDRVVVAARALAAKGAEMRRLQRDAERRRSA